MKTFNIIIHGIPIAKINIKSPDISQWLIIQNVNVFPNMNIKWLGRLTFSQIGKMEALLILKLDDAKIVNRIIDKDMLIGFGIYTFVLYNRECKKSNTLIATNIAISCFNAMQKMCVAHVPALTKKLSM